MPTSNTVYRVATTAKPAQVSTGLYEGVGDTVSLTASAASAAVGDQVTFTGTVSPDHTGHVIALQVETPKGGWQTVESGTIGSGSNYSLDDRFGKPGTYTIRTRVFGGPVNIGAASTPVTVTVAGDAPVSQLPAAS
jgi:plastocyanin